MNGVLKIISDPKIFNYLIIFLFICAGIRWGIAGNFWQALYWTCGAGINIAVTEGMT